MSFLFIYCCDIVDSCYDKLCLNESICNNGTCECLDGFEGHSCETISIPDSITVKKVIVQGFSSNYHYDHKNYDITESPPDIMICIGYYLKNDFDNEFIFQYCSEKYENETNYKGTFEFSKDLPQTFALNTDEYRIALYDYDEFINTNNDTIFNHERMAEINFKPYYLVASPNESLIEIEDLLVGKTIFTIEFEMHY